MSLVLTTVVLFLGEAMLALVFFFGALYLVRRFAQLLVGPRLRGLLEPSLTADQLVHFLWFQIVFVAVWSVCFKGVLYVTLKHSVAHTLLSAGQSLGIAIPAEVLIMFVGLVGAARIVSRRLRAS